MSFEALKDFFNNLDQNADLSEKFDALQGVENINTRVVELGKEFGFEFTEEELATVISVAKRIKAEQSEQAQ